MMARLRSAGRMPIVLIMCSPSARRLAAEQRTVFRSPVVPEVSLIQQVFVGDLLENRRTILCCVSVGSNGSILCAANVMLCIAKNMACQDELFGCLMGTPRLTRVGARRSV